jgi:hypothetical protein
MRLTHVGLVEPLFALAAILILQLAPAVLPHRSEYSRVEVGTPAGGRAPTGEATRTSALACDESTLRFHDAWLARC